MADISPSSDRTLDISQIEVSDAPGREFQTYDDFKEAVREYGSALLSFQDDSVRHIAIRRAPSVKSDIPVRVVESGGRMTISGIRHSVGTITDSILSGTNTKKEWRGRDDVDVSDS